MPHDTLELVVIVPGSPDRIYEAWLDSTHHSAFTGDVAEIDAVPGGSHSAWDGYITGKNLELEPGRRILQTWRTTEFPHEAGDSRLELLLESAEGGTRLVLKHSEIPEGQGAQYEEGWKEYYFEPMIEYFTNLAVSPAVAGTVRTVKAATRAPAKKAAPTKAAPKKAAPKKAAPKKAAPKKAKAKPVKKKAAPKSKKKAGSKSKKKPAPKAKKRSARR